jgi:UDP-2,4-diacetamido-2,4,6-trideoxy-beta-L-altropyranose hydrolase
MRVVIRADASLEIGTGHVMRTLTLADALRGIGANCSFVCRMHDGNLKRLISERGYEVHALPKVSNIFLTTDSVRHANWLGVNWEVDAKETYEVIGSKRVDLMIVDHYALDYRWEQYLRNLSNKIMVIDDLADRRHECNLLLDQNYGRSQSKYQDLLPHKAVKLLGPKYALLASNYSDSRKHSYSKNSVVKRILIFFGGGSDKFDVTGLTLNAFTALEFSHIWLDIVVSNKYAYMDALKHKVKKRGNANIYYSLADLAGLMQIADIAVGAGGTTTWERCSMGLPSIVICVAANQKLICEALADRGIIRYLGELTEVNACKLQEELRILMGNTELLNSLSKASIDLVDGKGTSRVIEAINLACHGISISKTEEN